MEATDVAVEREERVEEEGGAERAEQAEGARRRLLTRAELGLAEFASGNSTKYNLQTLHVTGEYAEATDGRVLMRVGRSEELEPERYPVVPGVEELEDGKLDTLIPAEAVRKLKIASSRSLPILECGMLGRKADGRKVLVSTDLETVQTVPGEVDGEYPESVDSFLPAEECPEGSVEVVLNAAYLKKIAAYALKHGVGRKDKPRGVTFRVSSDPAEPVGIFIRLEGGQSVRGVLMPMRG